MADEGGMEVGEEGGFREGTLVGGGEWYSCSVVYWLVNKSLTL